MCTDLELRVLKLGRQHKAAPSLQKGRLRLARGRGLLTAGTTGLWPYNWVPEAMSARCVSDIEKCLSGIGGMIDRSDERMPIIIEIYTRSTNRRLSPVHASRLVFTAVVFQLGTWESGPCINKNKIWGYLPESIFWTSSPHSETTLCH